MKASTVDECDGNFKSRNITVHGNVTIVKQKGPKLVYSAEQRKVLEIVTIVEESVMWIRSVLNKGLGRYESTKKETERPHAFLSVASGSLYI